MEADSWLHVQVRHLAALRAVAEEGSFSAAARRLGYTQSAVSQQIATLERVVGERLFDRPRGARTVRPTEVGTLLLGHAAAIVARLDAARADVDALAHGEARSLRVGVFQSVGARILPELMRRFTVEWPDLDVRLVEEHDDRRLVAAVESGELDIAFAMLPVESTLFESVRLLADRYVLLLPVGAPAPSEPVTASELASMRLIGFRTCRSWPGIAGQLRAAGGADDVVVFRSDDNRTVQALAAAGVGPALVPRLAVEENDPAIQVLETDPRLEPRVIGVGWHRDRYRSPAARRFVELAQQLCAEIDATAAAA
ncbi:MAG TPA: LysR family transcriptional regulator [Gaiellaceae bacterium]|nr:LysR family transcriptional regulator [Gaiellaceae bacterium]